MSRTQLGCQPALIDSKELRGQVLTLLKEEVGSQVEWVEARVGNQRRDYLVLLARLRNPSIEVVIKLAGHDSPEVYPFDRTAALQRLVAEATTIPMPEVIAVDVTCQKRPWRYFIKTYIKGVEWASARGQMSDEQAGRAFQEIGGAVAQIHSINFPGFGELSAEGQVIKSVSYLTAFGQRAAACIQDQGLQEIFFSVLSQHAPLFADICDSSLCHEDLHCHNILFEYRQGRWDLATILDFDKAWAGFHETDLARLSLWRGMTDEAFWQAYTAVRSIDPLFTQRRPVYQLLWCLEYARNTEVHLSDTALVCAELGIPPIERFV